jgi:hypothetical protein
VFGRIDGDGDQRGDRGHARRGARTEVAAKKLLAQANDAGADNITLVIVRFDQGDFEAEVVKS